MSDAEPQGERPANRLIRETSPYLRQHAHNPVDWYPWGEEALALARAEDRPILLSIGYSACHWCHVMEKESFENDATAALMNEHFVSVKVDREERPDLDALYMEAVQALTGSGGWPMTVFLTPDGAPFYGGTYFPPESRYGMPGFPTVLRGIVNLYRTKRDEVERQAAAFRDHYRAQAETRLALPADFQPESATVEPEALERAANTLLGQFDTRHGGLGGAPKFPQPMALEFLLRVSTRQDSQELDTGTLHALTRLTLDSMARGGLYDQIGGGFHRYSTDAIWLTPHFEKMLYDNALLASLYLHAWQRYGDDRYRRICEETLDYVLREMRDPAGGFYSTQDADSEGVEGKFYVWTPEQLQEVLDARDAAIVTYLWDVTPQGNFEGANILHEARTVSEAASAFDTTDDTVRKALDRAREALYARRALRVAPGRDDKVVTAWNGWMCRAFAEAARSLDRADYREAAVASIRFLTEHLTVAGALQRTWREGQAKIGAYLEDVASLANAALSVYEATGDAAYFTLGRGQVESLLARFWDDELGVFFDTATDAEALIGRPRDLMDNATPSGTSLACEALMRLWAYTGEDRYRAVAARILVPLAPAMTEHPSAFGHLLCALDDFIGPLDEIALVGAPDDAATQELLRRVNSRYLPRSVLAQGATDAEAVAPVLAGRTLVAGLPAIYVCQGFVCQRPVTSPDELSALLEGR